LIQKILMRKNLMSSKTINEIVVVGGGTAGWLTALLAKAYQPEKTVTLIESEEIGILGAGEGTVPWFVTVLSQVKIPVSYLFKRCKATLKNGILFSNWNGDNQKYFHSFGVHGDYSLDKMNYSRKLSLNSLLVSMASGTSTGGINLSERVSKEHKTGFVERKAIYNDTHDEFGRYDQQVEYALHFDARDLAVALRDVALSRGIVRVEGKVSDFETDTSNNIEYIVLENGQKVKSDFIFDCSGFRRLIIGKKYASSWKSVRDQLPCDRALPFFIPNNDASIPPYTEAIAMKYGWVWKIPVQGRYGCGYVFDSEFITEEQARSEITETFGAVDFGASSFKFDAGHFEEFWIKNCIAVGLSSGFLEPLEATSIWITTHMVQYALESFDQLEKQDQYVMNEYNEKFRKRFDDTVDFLRLHYITKRNDTDFWRKCKTLRNSEFLNQVLHKNSKRIMHYDDFAESRYELQSWLTILRGVELIDPQIVVDYLEKNNMKSLVPIYLEFEQNVIHIADKCISHKDFIDRVSL
jgi:tryptophan 7-halogenase